MSKVKEQDDVKLLEIIKQLCTERDKALKISIDGEKDKNYEDASFYSGRQDGLADAIEILKKVFDIG